MGSPFIYYKRALQYFANTLAHVEDDSLAARLFEEQSEEKLENFINEKKKDFDEKVFFFEAGRAYQQVSIEAWEEGGDALNASFGGLLSFAEFVGAREPDPDDD